jgi:N-acetyl sugar amidotransferase
VIHLVLESHAQQLDLSGEYRLTERAYQVCTRCVMDTSDSAIIFDVDGVCDHCSAFDLNILPNWHPNADGKKMFAAQVLNIKESSKHLPFDCIIGMSGGLDSSYLLHLAVTEFDLRPLVFHVDGGWNTDSAVHNIQAIVEKNGLDLYTEVINWREMRDFQLAFFKSGVPHVDHPQDHAFIATLYHFALKHKIRYIINGGNYATESIVNPKEWMYYGTDLAHLRDIQKQFCTVPLTSYPFSGILFHKVYLRYVRRIEVVKPLNFLPFSKNEAEGVLAETYGWRPYPQKHFESRFTKFYEGYWLPSRFGWDTRRVQFASLILSNQMTRDDALNALAVPAFDSDEIEEDFEYIATKLGVSTSELRSYHEMPKKSYKDYKHRDWMFTGGANAMRRLGLDRSFRR